jgi:hypothetical protein
MDRPINSRFLVYHIEGALVPDEECEAGFIWDTRCDSRATRLLRNLNRSVEPDYVLLCTGHTQQAVREGLAERQEQPV